MRRRETTHGRDARVALEILNEPLSRPRGLLIREVTSRYEMTNKTA